MLWRWSVRTPEAVRKLTGQVRKLNGARRAHRARWSDVGGVVGGGVVGSWERRRGQVRWRPMELWGGDAGGPCSPAQKPWRPLEGYGVPATALSQNWAISSQSSTGIRYSCCWVKVGPGPPRCAVAVCLLPSLAGQSCLHKGLAGCQPWFDQIAVRFRYGIPYLQ